MITHHIYLVCPNATEAEVRRFYTDGLGFAPVQKPDSLKDVPVAWFDGGNVVFHIGFSRKGTVGTSHVALAVADLDGLRARLMAVGATIDDNSIPMGYPRYYVRDPWGNQFEVLPDSVPQRP